ncbi:MAG: hypothetical protein ACRBBN_15155 [Methyloligellaceae bacterium]
MTILIAKIAGPYLVATALGFLISRSFYEKMVLNNQNADPILINLSGAVHFVVGMLILMNHFHWNNLSQISISLLGVLAVAKGTMMIVIPESMLKSPKTVGTSLIISMVIFMVVGFFFCYIGYFN